MISVDRFNAERSPTRDDQIKMSSTRKLLFEDTDKSDALQSNFVIKKNYQNNNRSIIFEEDEEDPHSNSIFHNNEPPKPNRKSSPNKRQLFDSVIYSNKEHSVVHTEHNYS